MRLASQDFYSACSTLIPVRVLVLVFEQRERNNELSPWQNLLLVLVGTGAGAVGEVAALRALYAGRSGPGDQWWVLIPLGALAVTLVVPILVGAARRVERTGGRFQALSSSAAWMSIVLLGWFIVVFVLAAVHL
jgi:hypothetical protein